MRPGNFGQSMPAGLEAAYTDRIFTRVSHSRDISSLPDAHSMDSKVRFFRDI